MRHGLSTDTEARLLCNGAECFILHKDLFDRTHGGSHQAKIVAKEGSMRLHGILRAAIYKKGKVILPVRTHTMRIYVEVFDSVPFRAPQAHLSRR